MDTIRCSGFVALFEARGEGKFSARTASFYLLITARSPGSILRGRGGREMEPDCAKIARIPFGEGERGVVGFFFNFGNINNVILRKCEY